MGALAVPEQDNWGVGNCRYVCCGVLDSTAGSFGKNDHHLSWLGFQHRQLFDVSTFHSMQSFVLKPFIFASTRFFQLLLGSARFMQGLSVALFCAAHGTMQGEWDKQTWFPPGADPFSKPSSHPFPQSSLVVDCFHSQELCLPVPSSVECSDET